MNTTFGATASLVSKSSLRIFDHPFRNLRFRGLPSVQVGGFPTSSFSVTAGEHGTSRGIFVASIQPTARKLPVSIVVEWSQYLIFVDAVNGLIFSLVCRLILASFSAKTSACSVHSWAGTLCRYSAHLGTDGSPQTTIVFCLDFRRRNACPIQTVVSG
jgi:hypothetical protein